MSGAIVAALKKIAVYIGTDKKALKTVLGIVLGVVVLLLLPIAAVLGIFSEGVDMSTARIEEIINEYQTIGAATLTEIEEKMLAAGYSEQKAEEAQAIYLLALFDKTGTENFVERLVACFAAEQTDEELINAVNTEFGTNLVAAEFAQAIREIREKYTGQEEYMTNKRCMIAKKIGRNKYRAISCKYYGELAHTGDILTTEYTDPQKVDELLALGDLYYLGAHLYWTDKMEPWETMTLAYGRDFQKKDCEAKEYTLEELQEIKFPYLYIFVKADKWIYRGDGELEHCFRDTKKALRFYFAKQLELALLEEQGEAEDIVSEPEPTLKL